MSEFECAWSSACVEVYILVRPDPCTYIQVIHTCMHAHMLACTHTHSVGLIFDAQNVLPKTDMIQSSIGRVWMGGVHGDGGSGGESTEKHTNTRVHC